MHAGDRTCLESDEWFASLRSSRREDILTHARSSTLPPGALIYGMSDPPNGLWAVLEGQVQLKGYPTPGLEFLAMTVGPGRWFGELSVLDGGPRPHDATVSVSSRLLHLPVAAVHALGETSPDFYLDLARLACRHQRLALDFIAQTVGLSPEVRLARLLDSRTAEVGDRLSIRQEDLAVMLSVSRQTLNRHLRMLVRAGIIRASYREIEVLDRHRLQLIADPSA